MKMLRLLPAALCATAIAFGSAAVAHADRVFDLEEYDTCMLLEDDYGLEKPALCCIRAGGDWDAEKQQCYVPAERTITPPGVITAPLTPGPMTAPITRG